MIQKEILSKQQAIPVMGSRLIPQVYFYSLIKERFAW